MLAAIDSFCFCFFRSHQHGITSTHACGNTHQNFGLGWLLDLNKPDPVLNKKWLDFDTLF